MKELKTLLFVVIAAAFFIGLFVLSDRFADDIHTEYASLIASPIQEGDSVSAGPVDPEVIQVEKWIENKAQKENTAEFTITAAGDILCQEQQLINAYNEETDSYDFTEAFRYVKQMLAGDDFTAATLKTTMAGIWNGYDSSFNGYTAYMGLYNTPESLAGTLADSGFDLLNTANNHSLDSGAEGVFSTIDNLTAAGISHVGTAKEETDPKSYILTQNGVKIAFTGWTSHTNDMTAGDEYDYAVNSLDDNDRQMINRMCQEVSKLQDENDFVIVMLNFGSADSSEIESEQRDLARNLAEAGADLILGTGSMAVKPMEILTYVGEDGFQYETPVFYGLGDLISSESYSNYEYEELAVDFGMLLKLHVMKNINGVMMLTSFDVYPTYLDWTDEQVTPIPALAARNSDQFSTMISEEEQPRLQEGPEKMMEKLVSESGLSYKLESDHFTVNLE